MCVTHLCVIYYAMRCEATTANIVTDFYYVYNVIVPTALLSNRTNTHYVCVLAVSVSQSKCHLSTVARTLRPTHICIICRIFIIVACHLAGHPTHTLMLPCLGLVRNLSAAINHDFRTPLMLGIRSTATTLLFSLRAHSHGVTMRVFAIIARPGTRAKDALTLALRCHLYVCLHIVSLISQKLYSLARAARRCGQIGCQTGRDDEHAEHGRTHTHCTAKGPRAVRRKRPVCECVVVRFFFGALYRAAARVCVCGRW